MKSKIKTIRFTFLLISNLCLNITLYAQEPLEEILTIQNPWQDYQFSSYIQEGSGDVNGDGFSDFILTNNDNTSSTSLCDGEVLLYLGKPHLTETPDFVFTSNNNHNFGRIASLAGDINGDGYDDLIISEIFADPAGAGAVYIYLGGNPFDNEVDFVLNGASYAQVLYINLNFGWFLSADNDFNNDGYDDLVIGSPGPSMSWEGQIDVFLGGEPFDTESDFCLYGHNYFDFYGSFITGDLNGDGYDDLLSGHTEDNDYIIDIYPGCDDFPPNSSITSLNMDSLGYDNKAIVSENIDTDSQDELIYTFANIEPFYKTINLLSFNEEFQIIQNNSIPYNYIDYGVISQIFFTDINNDEENDIVISSESDSYHHYAGAINLYFGGTLLDTIPDLTMTGSVNFEYFGKVGYNLGDVNGDGNTDILLGSSTHPIGTITDYVTIYTEENLVSVQNETISLSTKLYNFPNPFNPITTVYFSSELYKQNEQIELNIYNIRGQNIRQFSIYYPQSSITWNGTDQNNNPVSSGVYLYKLKSGNRIIAGNKCLLLK